MELRERILAAAEQVVLLNGLARTTTKEIARAAGCSEGSIYNHFENKEELFFHVLRNQLANLMRLMKGLPERTGNGTVRDTLNEIVTVALEDYYNSMPFVASVFAEPGLMQRHRDGFVQRNEGPHRANEAVAAYLLKEQKLGRIGDRQDPRAVADMLLGSCFQRAFQMKFASEPMTEQAKAEFARPLLDTLFHQG